MMGTLGRAVKALYLPLMNTARRNSNILLLLSSAIWGFAFVAQRVGMRYIEPFTFNGIRFAIGAMVLVPVLLLLRRRTAAAADGPRPGGRAMVIKGGLAAGLFIFCGATLQQFGMVYTTAGKAGFITGLYVVFVPLLGLFIGHRTPRVVWLGASLAAAGLYLLSAKGLTGIELGDGLVLLSALFWACHVLLIGKLARLVAPVQLAVTQFTVVSVLSCLGALIFENPALGPILEASVPILYAGLLSVGVAYTLQVVAQRNAKPAHAAIILSMESVFAVLGGWLILDESLPVRGLIGCALMLGGVLVVQAEGDTPE